MSWQGVLDVLLQAEPSAPKTLKFLSPKPFRSSEDHVNIRILFCGCERNTKRIPETALLLVVFWAPPWGTVGAYGLARKQSKTCAAYGVDSTPPNQAELGTYRTMFIRSSLGKWLIQCKGSSQNHVEAYLRYLIL